MKLKLLLILALGVFASNNSDAQTVKKIISYAKDMNDSRILALLSDNTLWWYGKKEWQQVATTNLPAKTEILDVEAYVKYGMMGTSDTRLIILSADNTIWWYAEKKGWEKIETSGMPANTKIKDLTVHTKTDGLGYGSGSGSMRLIAQLDNGSLWWFAPKSDWQKVPLDGLPVGK